jgi:cytochrome c oxidase assembly protein subunit 11
VNEGARNAPETTRRSNRAVVLRLLGVAIAMFGFGLFAMPPLYQTFCEFTGIGQAGVRIADGDTASLKEHTRPGRQVKIRFDATTNSTLNWDFRPMQKTMEVSVGVPSEALYFAANRDAVPVAGMATFNVSPPQAARYFTKVECFCFSRQVLEGGESREMPVYFLLQPDIPEDISELTLSYTFFKNEDPGLALTTP